MVCRKDIFNEMRLYYKTIHLFKNYYLMRNNRYSNMGPSLWGIVKVVDPPSIFIPIGKYPF